MTFFGRLKNRFRTGALLACIGASCHAAPQELSLAQARHLLARTGFGASPTDIGRFMGMSANDAVDVILSEAMTEPSRPMPDWVDDWKYPANVIYYLGDTATDLFYTQRSIDLEELTTWWLAEMVQTPSPLTERMVLFWHDHFATSFSASDNAQWMGEQNAFFRRHALGDFAHLAHGVLMDPAVLNFLSNTENQKDSPNENLAREYFELFTLGEGRGYTEDDIKEAARALTGHGTNWAGSPDYKFHPDQHDNGKKVIFGHRGRFDAADLPALVMAHPDFGGYIVEKLWRTFISHEPAPEQVVALTATWRDHRFQIAPLLRAMLLTEDFWAQENRGTLVKSPVELFVGTVRTLGLSIDDMDAVRWALEEMGQELFVPPNVAGWTGGVAWINDASVLLRAESLAHLSTWRSPLVKMTTALEQPVEPQREPNAKGDFRVGTVIVLEAGKQDNGDSFATYLHLFDVSYGDNTWRSLTFWIEDRVDEPPSISVKVTDCAPECFPQWPRAEWDEDMVSFSAQPDWFDDYRGTLSDEDITLMAQIIGHLPALLQETHQQNIWDPAYHEPEYRDEVAGFVEIDGLLNVLRNAATPILGPLTGQLMIAPSRQGLLGIGPADNYTMLEDEAEMMMAMSAEARKAHQPPITPPTHYPTHAAWLDALPGVGLESKRAEQVLLSTIPFGQSTRQEMRVGDADALIRRILLSPLYQLN